MLGLWIEAFAYMPATYSSPDSRWGAGTGLQYLLGGKRLWSVDIAGNLSQPNQFQLLFGISGKLGLLSARKPHENL